MSTLLVDELYDGVEAPQTLIIYRDMDIAHIRIHLYKHDICTTDLILSVYQGTTLLKESTVLAADFNAALDNTQPIGTYFHGMVRFDFNNLSLRVAEGNTEEEYNFILRGTGGSTTNFVGIVRIYENKIYDTYGTGVIAGEAPNDYVEPFHFELDEYKYT